MTQEKSRINWVVLACFTVLFVSMLVLLGWTFDIKVFKSVLPGFI